MIYRKWFTLIKMKPWPILADLYRETTCYSDRLSFMDLAQNRSRDSRAFRETPEARDARVGATRCAARELRPAPGCINI